MTLITPLAEQRNIRIITTHNDEEISLEQGQQLGAVIHADRIRLKQALINLLSNAVKYNHEHGQVGIDLHKFDDRLRISINDTGQGISADQQSQLFQPFNRLGAENSETEGTGIGLAFSKKIVELMGGSLGMRSTPDKGSCFWIELPGYYQSKTTEATVSDEEMNVAPPSTSKQKHIQYTVLYVEDNPANMNLMEQMLKHRPEIHLLKAYEPLLGLELATHYQPDLIVLDINLPGISGYDMLKLLQEGKATQATPVMAISANAMPANIQKGLDAGFVHYMTKPFKLEQLLDTLDNVLVNSQAEVKG